MNFDSFKFDLSGYEGIEGKLILKTPTQREKLMMARDCKLQMDSKGNVVLKDMTSKLDMVINLLSVTEPFFKEVDIKIPKKEIHVKSYAQMEKIAELETLIIDASSAVMNAGNLGK